MYNIYNYIIIIYIHITVLLYKHTLDEDGYFGQQQVPLTDEIKEILEEYPDGQIFKVN